MSENSTIPAPPGSEPIPASTPKVEIRGGRVVILSNAATAALAIEKERERVEADFSAIVEKLTAIVLPKDMRPVRDIVLVEGQAVCFMTRGELETYVRGLLKELGLAPAEDPTSRILNKMLVLLGDAERSPSRREGKLPCMIVLGHEARLAWLTVGIIKREGGTT